MPWPELPVTAGVAETVWTAATAVGVVVAALGASITTTNLRAAQRAHRRACSAAPVNRLHTSITAQAVRNEALSVGVLSLLLFVLALFVAIGVVAMLTPEPVREALRAGSVASSLVLVAGAMLVTVTTVVLSVGSVLNRRDRHRLVNRIAGRLLADQLTDRLRQIRSGEHAP